MASRPGFGFFGRVFSAITLLSLLAGCSGQLPPVLPVGETPVVEQTPLSPSRERAGTFPRR